MKEYVAVVVSDTDDMPAVFEVIVSSRSASRARELASVMAGNPRNIISFAAV